MSYIVFGRKLHFLSYVKKNDRSFRQAQCKAFTPVNLTIIFFDMPARTNDLKKSSFIRAGLETGFRTSRLKYVLHIPIAIGSPIQTHSFRTDTI